MDTEVITEDNLQNIITADKVNYERLRLAKIQLTKRNDRVKQGIRGLYIDGKEDQAWSKKSQFGQNIRCRGNTEHYILIQVLRQNISGSRHIKFMY